MAKTDLTHRELKMLGKAGKKQAKAKRNQRKTRDPGTSGKAAVKVKNDQLKSKNSRAISKELSRAKRVHRELKGPSTARRLALVMGLASLPFIPRLMAKYVEMEGERKGYGVQQFKLTTRDGTRLSAALYTPKGDGPFPAVIMVHSWMFSRWQCHLYAPYFATAGYVVLTYDCRGWGTSQDQLYCADPEHEIKDLEEAIDWLLEKSGVPIKEGALGVTGISYGGGHSFLIAARDPRVKAVAPMNGWTELKESLTPRNSTKISWGALLVLTASWATKLNPRNILYRWLSIVLFRRDDLPAYEEEMRRRSCLYDVENISCPMLIVGSWNDDIFEPNQMMDFYEKLDAPKMLYIDKGIHGLDAGFGPRWRGKEIWDLTRRWFDYWLKGEENGILDEPAVRLYKPWEGRMVPEDSWPPPGVEKHVVYLGKENGTLKMSSKPKGERGEMKLKPNLLSAASSGPSVVRPQSFGIPMPGPRREAGDGYFSFTTSPAKRDFEVVGIPRLRITVNPLQKRVQINALLYDVTPESDKPVLITYGTATFEDLVPGEEKTVELDLIATDYMLKTGHRFRLTLSGTNMPFVLPVLGEGTNVIFGNGESTLELPLRVLKGD